MATNITLEPGGPRPPTEQEKTNIRASLGVASSDAFDGLVLAVDNLETNSATVAALDATNVVVDSLVAAKDLEEMDQSRIYEVGEAFHYDGRNWRCDTQGAIGETPDTNPEKFSEIGATPTGELIKQLYEVQPNAFTDPLFTKLDGIEDNATADLTGPEIKALYEVQPNAFDDTQFTTLSNISVTQAVDLDALELDSHTHDNKAVLDNTEVAYTLANATKLADIEANANNYTAADLYTDFSDITPPAMTAPEDVDQITVWEVNGSFKLLKTITFAEFAAYVGTGGGGGTSQTVDANFDIQATDENTTQGGSVAGDARGEYAVDLQTLRIAGSMVAW